MASKALALQMQQLQQQVAEGLSAAASLQRDKQAAADQAHQVYICLSVASEYGFATIPAQVCYPFTTTSQLIVAEAVSGSVILTWQLILMHNVRFDAICECLAVYVQTKILTCGESGSCVGRRG